LPRAAQLYRAMPVKRIDGSVPEYLRYLSRFWFRGDPIRRGVAAAGLGMLLLLGMVSAGGADAGRSDTRQHFDLPEAPLIEALGRFMARTNIIVVVDGALVAGHHAAAVKGDFTPEGALQSMLSGTGLEAQEVGAGAFTLIRDERPEVRPPPDFIEYASAVQTALATALCRRSDTKPTYYRTVMRLWFDHDGNVRQVELAISTGDGFLDTKIVTALRGLAIGTAPPPDLPQPMKLAILPRAGNDSMCRRYNADGRVQPNSATRQGTHY
jgi:hypothetical protein